MEGEIVIKDMSAASPAAVGFFGLGFAATFAGLLNAGIFSDALMVIAMAITLGGIAEIIAGLQLCKKGDTFGATAFTIFGLWWIAFSYINLAPAGLFNAPMEAASATSMAFFTLFWGLIATALTIATLKIGVKAITLVFIVLDLTFFSLALVFFGMFPLMVSGIITLITGLIALYIGIALVYDSVGIKVPL
ncbi:acetate uptake transporter [Methanolobus bombayensis]|uniref:acetate uptake transporter n=1 Tax=Methanolobus bombayensis TaxID=38023 RepID=UPI001AE67500|nr:acetate uptake transporter [Methanolobus bombayensis]MBP1909847.1 succinate-acetate transporter protein [Methanolobus bombayensis]